jgi:hypothetical protein
MVEGYGWYYSGILLPSVAQPPLPLQEFLPLQPLSLALQPPLPLQEFWPLQACFSFTFFSVLVSSCAAAEALAPGTRFEALMLAPVPASKPAIAAPVSRNLFDFVISPTSSSMNLTAPNFRQKFCQKTVRPAQSTLATTQLRASFPGQEPGLWRFLDGRSTLRR